VDCCGEVATLVPEHQDLDVFRCVDRASSASQLSTRASVK